MVDLSKIPVGVLNSRRVLQLQQRSEERAFLSETEMLDYERVRARQSSSSGWYVPLLQSVNAAGGSLLAMQQSGNLCGALVWSHDCTPSAIILATIASGLQRTATCRYRQCQYHCTHLQELGYCQLL